MRKLLLNPTPLFRKLRQLSMLLTLLLALPQTAMGATETVTKTITLNKSVSETNFPEGQNLTWGSITLPVTITENSITYDGQITIKSASISSYSSDTNGAVFKMKGDNASNSEFHLEVPGNYPAIPSSATVKAAYTNCNNNGGYYFSIGIDETVDQGNTHNYNSTVGPNNSGPKGNGIEAEFTGDTNDGKPNTNRDKEGELYVYFYISAITNPTNEADRTTVTVKEITITYERDTYGLTIGNTVVKSDNRTDILGDGKVSYVHDATNNSGTLTLNGASITSTSTPAIDSSLGSLTVKLAGTNTINCGSNNAFNLAANSGLNFTADGTSPGQLTITSTSAITTESFYSPSTATVTYTDLVATNPTSTSVLISPPTSYNITVAGVDVTNANASAITGTGITGTVSYDATTNTLTLNGATINGNINYNGTTDFTIALNGSNSIVNTNGNYAIVTNTTTNNKLKFEKATNASTAELTLKWASGDKAISANDSILGNGLYWKPIAATQMNITDNPEFVIVGDYAIPDGTTVNGTTSGTITYNATDKLLTISSFSETYDKDAIKTGVSGLKVKLVGESVVTCNSYDKRVFIAFATSASIQFVKNDASSKLTMSTILDPLYGFAAEAITYDGLFYYNAGNNQYIIRPKFSPTIKFVERDQSNGNIPSDPNNYVYVSGTGAIQMSYVASYYAPKPVFSDHYQLGDSTRYEYTMSVDGMVQFTRGGTTQGNPGKIDYADNGEVSIQKSGTVTITCSFPGNMQNNACSASYTLNITRDFNNPFATQPAEQIYATYYNEYEDLSLPDGIEAYIVTGVNGNTVTTAATGYLPHEVPVLLEKTGNVGTTITGYTGSAGNFNGSLLKYTNANAGVNTTGKEYILYKNEFVKATGTINGACYLDLNGVAPTRGMYGIGNDGSTAIEGIDVEATEDETWYDLQGRRIQKPTKAGIYIVNGKKMIVK